MTQKGTHTWDIIIDYHQCPSCGLIMESREKHHYELEKLVKDLTCERCGHTFQVKKVRKPKFGPIWDQEWRLFG